MKLPALSCNYSESRVPSPFFRHKTGNGIKGGKYYLLLWLRVEQGPWESSAPFWLWPQAPVCLNDGEALLDGAVIQS